MVTMMLIAPMIDDCAHDVHREDAGVHAGPICSVSGAIQRPAGGGRAAGHEERAAAAGRRNQQPEAEVVHARQRHVGAPICSGIIQFAKPTKAGMIAPNTMISRAWW
jgi:hypothetical protein